MNQASITDQQDETTPQFTGAEILIKCLHAENVQFVFGYPGGAVLNIYDAIYQQDQFEHILVRHEQAALHAADAYARATGKVGVALVTSGPGATNAVTGIATAYMDSIPMVVISGQVPTYAIGEDAFQECDTVGITRPCVKHNFLIKDINDIAPVMKKAFHVAATGRPGPVLVDIPKDITATLNQFEYPETVEIRSYNPITKGHSGQIKKALKLLSEAKRPMVYTGGGVVLGNASEELTQFVRSLGLPTTSTLMGLGGFPATDKQSLGMLGMHGTYEANMAMQECDVLIAVGARFDDRVIGNPEHFLSRPRTIIHIDIDPSSISKRVKIDVPIVGDVKSVLGDLNTLIETEKPVQNTAALADWMQQIEAWRGKRFSDFVLDDKLIKPQQV
ncbi:MAG: biosynthetic-type acetolactate synthase large subunit, partial [Methylophilaceae bacterium]|nr:biosynthetic-type acetolactate synthase large subunit [Methylophilaceae bacterium]